MKKTIKSLLAIAITALAFTACSDVPEPYQTPGTGGGTGGGGEIPGATGTGQLTDPYNVAAAMNTGGTTDWVYVKGIVSKVREEYTTQYGNGTFYISDDGTYHDKKDFLVYRALYLGNKKFANGDDQIKVGDKVLICGVITNYNGTIETTQNQGFIYELNGVNRGGDPTGGTGGEQKGTGTQADPFNVAAAVAKCKATGETATTESYYIKGIAAADYTVDNYKNVTVDILDSEGATEKFTVYRVKDKDGKGIKEGYKIAKGATIIVYGPVVNFKGNTPETATGAYLVSVNGQAPEVEGGDSPTPSGDGDGTEAKPYDVTAAIAKTEQTGVFIKAFIVGFVEGQVYNDGATFSSASTTQSNILIAASADETDATKCMPVQLPSGDIRTKLNLQNNAGNYKKEVILYGDIIKYFGVPGLKNTSYAVIDGTPIGKNPNGSGDTPGDEGIKKISIADFNAAAESDTQWYQLTGTVKNLKDGDLYGNFDLEDATGSVYVYGLLSEKGGAKKLFQELAAAKGITNGSKITIIGLRSSYNGSIQVKNAYFVSIEGGSSSGSGNTGADGSTIISVADFNAAAESTTVWYQLTGSIKNLKDGDLYGNFDLEDNTGSVYVYGVLSEKGGAKKLFQELVAAKGIANGKKITIVGNRGSYNGKIEVMNAYFIKIE